MIVGRPAAEVAVDEPTIRTLLSDQHPDLASLNLTFVDEGWDNFTYRLGTRAAVRLPRRAAAVDLTRIEHRWLPELAARLPLAVPAPVRIGTSGAGYPWPWSVVPWIDGRPVDEVPLGEDQATRLAAFLLALHLPAPQDAPVNPHRTPPLVDRDASVSARLDRADLSGLRDIWRDAVTVPPPSERTWIHGDLHTRNVLARDGQLVGVIDWGDLNGGDPATDLAGAWFLFDTAGAREEFFASYGASDATRRRAAGWAVNLALAHLISGDPRHAAVGLATQRRLEEDF